MKGLFPRYNIDWPMFYGCMSGENIVIVYRLWGMSLAQREDIFRSLGDKSACQWQNAYFGYCVVKLMGWELGD